METLVPSVQQINQLRNAFLETYEQKPPEVPFHPADIDRVRNDDIWCIRFLEQYDLDLNMSLDKLWSTCIWRKQFGANDLDESKVRMDYLTDGSIFPHNKDVDGKRLLIFKTKRHVKGAKDMNDILKVLIYWVERLHRETHLDKITIFFDMDGTGLSNMDLEFVKMVIETFKQYYPNALNYILVFEMAWVLNAVFKVVKALLPEKAVSILKIINKKNIDEFVDKNNCLTCWGGNDNYEFTFVPEKKPSMMNGTSAPATPTAQVDQANNVQDKKVHFANSSPTRPVVEQQMHDIPETMTQHETDMLRVSPQDFLKFTRGDTKESVVELTCTSRGPVTYKIQTTSPEKFRVRPRCGVLSPGESVSVNIQLKPEQHLSDNAKDKFLIMCLPSMDIAATQVTDFWKKHGQNSADMEQHRLCCVYKDSPMPSAAVAGAIGYGDSKLVSASSTKKLEKQLRLTQILQIITLVFLLILSAAVVYLLKLQLCSDGSCMSRNGSSDTCDDDSCARGNEDL